MKIGISGGTCNPPHLGHVAAARAEFKQWIALEKAQMNASPKPQENRAQGKPQGETPKEPQNE